MLHEPPSGGRPITDSEPSYVTPRHVRVSSALLYGDQLFYHKSNDGILSCVDAKTGEDIWEYKDINRTISTCSIA